jgi:hypothetical protein
MYANHKHLILLALAVLAFVAAVSGFWYVRSRIYTQAIRANELEKENLEIEKKKKHELEVRDVYTKLTDDSSNLETNLVSKDAIVEFIEVLEKIGDDTSTTVTLSGIETENIVKTARIQDNFSHVTARLSASGDWSNLMRALHMLENSQFSITYDNVQLYVDAAPEVVDPSKTASSTKPVAKQNFWRLTMDLRALVAP